MRGLYVVTPDWDDTPKLLAITEMALSGGAALVQYRNKTASPALRQEQAECLLQMCQTYQRPFIINDHVDLCLAVDADGVHLGATDNTIAAVRSLLGPDKLIGASCYGSMTLAHAAQQAGASYVAFGGFYPSRVKNYPVTTSPDIIAQAKAELTLPCAVIGGMTRDNALPLVMRGADMVAAISSIYMAGDPEDAARKFAALFR